MKDVGHDIEALVQARAGVWLHFRNPARLVEALTPGDVRAAIAEVERLTRDYGYHAVGSLTYEAGEAFGLSVCHDEAANSLPLAWFACFEHPVALPSETAFHVSNGTTEARAYEVGTLSPGLDFGEFQAAVHRIKRHIADGDTY